MAKSYVAGVLQGIKRLQGNLASLPEQTARELLRSCLFDEPTPPWDSGDLRNSGAAYVGTRRVVKSTDFQHWGRNPTMLPGETSRKLITGQSYYSKFGASEREGSTFTGAPLGSSRNTVSVVFKTDYADAMHNTRYNPREPGSGPNYVSDKLLKFGTEFTMLARKAIISQAASDRLAFGKLSTMPTDSYFLSNWGK